MTAPRWQAWLQVLIPLVLVAAVFGLWQLLAVTVYKGQEYVLPKPVSVFSQLGSDWDVLQPDLLQTVKEFVLGFFAGLSADVLPPTHHYAGELAFAYTVIGYVAGMLDAGEESSVLTIISVVAGASIGVVVLYAGLGDLLGNARITAGATLHALAGTVVYDVVLAPFVVPLVSAAARRLEPVGSR